MANARKIRYISDDGSAAASKVTSRNDARYALLGKWEDGTWKVLSIHARRDLVPTGIHNERYSAITVGTAV